MTYFRIIMGGVLLACLVVHAGCDSNESDASSLVWQERAPLDTVGEALAVTPGGFVISAARGEVHRSTDQAASWEALDATGLPRGAVTAMVATDEDSLLVYVWGHGLYGSDDGGTSWSALGEIPFDPLISVATNTRAPMVPFVLASDPDDASHVLAGGAGGLAATDDGGVTWRSISVPGGDGGANILFTGAAVRGDTMYATAQLPVGILPPFFLEILAGGVYVSTDRGATWQTLGDPFPTSAPSSIALGPGGTIYAAAQDGGLHRLDPSGSWEALGGPSDVLAISATSAGVAVASGNRGPWLWNEAAESWSRAAQALEDGDGVVGVDAGTVAVASRYALLSDGRVFALGGGTDPEPSTEPAGGTVYLAFSMHTNLYHSFRGNTNDDDGFGLDIRVIRNTLDWLDELPEVHADWDIENYFSVDGWLEEFAPDILARIRARREAGQDGIRLMSWNNGSVSWQTYEEFEQSVERAKTSYIDAFGSFDPGVQPQENMFSPDHVGWYRDLGIEWITLFNSMTPFTGIPSDVELEEEALFNPVTLLDGEDTMTLIPVYHHADVLNHGNLAGWAQQLSDRFERDVLLVIHFDADGETWLNFDDEIRAAAELDFVEFTTLQGYLDTHLPVDEITLPGDLADGVGDGFFSWAEKQVNQYVSTRVAHARELTDWARALAPDDQAVEALVQEALETRLLTLSTTNFGLSASFLHPDRETDARAFADESLRQAQAALDAASTEAGAPAPGTIEIVHVRESAGTALVEIDLEVAASAYEGVDGLVLRDDGVELAAFVEEVDATGDPVDLRASVVLTLSANETKVLAWSYDPASPRTATGSVGSLPSVPLQAPFTQCDGVVSTGTVASSDSGVDDDEVRRFESQTYDLAFCDGTGQVSITQSIYDGHPGVVIAVDAQMGTASNRNLAESVALTPLTCPRDVERLHWQTMGGVERSRAPRLDQQTWNPFSPDAWFGFDCEGGDAIRVSHRVRERTSIGPVAMRNDEGQALFAPLGTLWGNPPFHSARRIGGYGVGDVVYQIIGDNMFQPVAPDWSGAEIQYRLLVGTDVDAGTLDLFAHPPLVRVGEAVD